MNVKGIKAILFDSGRVLNRPKTGNWFISPNFYQYVSEDTIKKLNQENVNRAFRKAYDYICSQHKITTREEEYKHFYQFYSIIRKELPDLSLDRKKVAEITKDIVYNDDKYVFYDDVYEIIPKLEKKYDLGIISDAWPSLINVYEKANLHGYFKVFVISTLIGVEKPNPKMYTIALDALKIKPHEALFIDDRPSNCQGAQALGIPAMVLSRNEENMLHHDFPVISGLQALASILELDRHK